MMLFLVRMWRRLFRFSGTMRVGRIRFMGRLLMLGMRSLLIPSMSRSVWTHLEQTREEIYWRRSRRVWSDHSVELPSDGTYLSFQIGENTRLIKCGSDGCLEVGSCFGLRQHSRPQARRANTVVSTLPGHSHQGSRLPSWRRQRRAWIR